MNRKEANKIIEKHSAAFGALPREAIEAIEYLINEEPCRETDDYENEIADLQNRLDIAEYDRDRWKEKVTVLEEKLKSLSAEPCEDAISRRAAIDAVKKNTFRLTFAEEQGCEGHVAWSAKAVYSDVIEGALLELPPVTPQEQEPCEDCISRQAGIDAFERFIHELGIEDEPYNYGEMALSSKNVPSVTPKQKVGHWIDYQKNIWIYAQCSECGTVHDTKTNYCPNCGAKMAESEVSE